MIIRHAGYTDTLLSPPRITRVTAIRFPLWLMLLSILIAGCSREETVERIVFTSDRGGDYEIFIANTDGNGLKQVTHYESNDLEPSLAPDGRIAFYSNRDGDSEIFTINIDGTGLTQLTDNTNNDIHPAWSPDGRKIAFLRSSFWGGYDVYIMNRNGTNQTNITNTPEQEYWVNWSPDGRKVAFAKTVDGNSDIYTIKIDGTGLQRLTTDPAFDRAPSWSPDGAIIVFHSDMNAAYGENCIYTMNNDGSGIKQVTSGHHDNEPTWSPNGKRLALYRSGRIILINLDGSGEFILTESEGYNTCPDWKRIRIKEEYTGVGLLSWNRY